MCPNEYRGFLKKNRNRYQGFDLKSNMIPKEKMEELVNVGLDSVYDADGRIVPYCLNSLEKEEKFDQ